MPQPLVLSASSISTFLRCGLQWYYAYVVGIKAPPSLRAVRGIAAHRAVEVDMRQKITSGIDVPVDDMLDAFDSSWTEETVDGFEVREGEEPGDVKDKGYALVKLYHREVAPHIQPTLVEEPIQFTINGQVYSGQIDIGRMVTEDAWDGPVEKLELRDTKTTGRTPSGSAYLLNMTGYAVGLRQARHEVESDVVFDYLIANQTPTYKELRLGGPISDDQIRRFGVIVDSVASAIETGRFVPNGLLSNACGFCGYRPICPAYLRQDPTKGP